MLDSRHDGKHSIALISLFQVLTACFGTDWVCEQVDGYRRNADKPNLTHLHFNL